MSKFLISLIMSILAFNCATAQFYSLGYGAEQNSQTATMKFSNSSDYTLTIKIINYDGGGLYQRIVLTPHSSRIVSFKQSAKFKMKIKADYQGNVSYHKGGIFSVTNNYREYSQGEMTFSMSTYGSGLGPSISASEFSKDNE